MLDRITCIISADHSPACDNYTSLLRSLIIQEKKGRYKLKEYRKKWLPTSMTRNWNFFSNY